MFFFLSTLNAGKIFPGLNFSQLSFARLPLPHRIVCFFTFWPQKMYSQCKGTYLVGMEGPRAWCMTCTTHLLKRVSSDVVICFLLKQRQSTSCHQSFHGEFSKQKVINVLVVWDMRFCFDSVLHEVFCLQQSSWKNFLHLVLQKNLQLQNVLNYYWKKFLTHDN